MLVLEAVCVLMGVKPTRVMDKESGKMVDSYAAASKKLLTGYEFVERIR
jgi:hypothetical protein